MRLPGLRVLLLVPAVVLVASCSASVEVGDTDPSVTRSDVEARVAGELADQGLPEDGQVACPEDLEGEVGATMSCEVESASDPGSRARINLEVTDVDGSDVGFDYDVVPLLPAELVEQQVSAGLTREVGQTPDDVSCPDEVDATVEASTTCVLTAGQDTLDFEATVSEVDGSGVSFDIQVADSVNE